MKHEVVFVKEKETPNTVKFNEVPRPGVAKVIGALYVQKWAVGKAGEIKVTVEVPDASSK